MLFTRALLLNLCLLSSTYADKESSDDALTWLEVDRSVLVHLPTPDLFCWSGRGYMTQYPRAFIFNFTLTLDGRTLLLNDEAILPRPSPYVPARLRAYQISFTAKQFKDVFAIHGNRRTPPPMMDLDYYIDMPDATDETSIYNTKYNPRIRFNLLRANVDDGPSVPISSPIQKEIWIHLEDLSDVPPGTPYSEIPLIIQHVSIDQRWGWEDQEGYGYKALGSLRTCYIWSWLCADTPLNEYPYYNYVYQENFDEFGKKGSMRHFLTMRYANLVGLLGFGQAIILLAVCGSMVFSPFVYAVSQGVKTALHLYRSRIQEVDDWNADEEVEGVLMHDRYFEAFKDVVEGGDAEKKGGEKVCAESSSESSLDSSVESEKGPGL